MKAMIFAAGLGTRLQPITNNIPKALVPYKNKPLLQITIEKLIDAGINEIIINVHHFSNQIIDFLYKNNNFNAKIIISDETNQLLDTGGGLFNAKDFLNNSNFLVHNVDIISDLNLNELIEHHYNSQSIATLAVQDRHSDKKLYFDTQSNCLCFWRNEHTGQEKKARKCTKTQGFAYSGIFVANSNIFNFMQEGVYSIIDTFLLVAQNNKISYFDHSNTFWRDMGKPASFLD